MMAVNFMQIFRGRKIVLMAFALMLGGCSYSGIKPIGKDTYMAARTKSAFASGGEALADLYEQAYPFCEDQGLSFVPIHESAHDGVPGHFASATIEFRCVPKRDPEDRRPKIHPDASLVIERND